jgi:hypothetical protein
MHEEHLVQVSRSYVLCTLIPYTLILQLPVFSVYYKLGFMAYSVTWVFNKTWYIHMHDFTLIYSVTVNSITKEVTCTDSHSTKNQ